MSQLRALFILITLAAPVTWFLFGRGRHAESSPQGAHVAKLGFNAGDIAPDFDLRSLDGSRLKLSQLRGKPVLLNFWATWCAPCRIEMPWLVELDHKYRAEGVQIIGVSLDDSGSEAQVSSYAKENGVQYQVLLGDPATANTYGGVRFLPQSFFVDAQGKIIKATAGLTTKQDFEDGVRALLASGAPQMSQREQP